MGGGRREKKTPKRLTEEKSLKCLLLYLQYDCHLQNCQKPRVISQLFQALEDWECLNFRILSLQKISHLSKLIWTAPKPNYSKALCLLTNFHVSQFWWLQATTTEKKTKPLFWPTAECFFQWKDHHHSRNPGWTGDPPCQSLKHRLTSRSY